MSSSSLESRGLFGNALIGYHLAWVHRRQLPAVLLPILAPALLGLLLLNVFPGRDQALIINGALIVHGADGSVLAWAKLGLMTAFWLVALAAGGLTVVGAVRGHTVRPVKAILAAVGKLPLYAAVLLAVGGAAYLVMAVFAGFGASVGGRFGFALLLLAFAATVLLAARLLIALLTPLLGGPGWGLTEGRVTSTAGAFLLGGVVVPVLLSAARDRVLSTPWPVLTEVIDPVLLTVVVAAQAGIIAHIVLLRENEDLDARLAPLTGGTPRPLWPAVAVVLVPVLLSIGATADPFGVPSQRSHGDAPGSGTVAVAWPANQHPVLATTTGARFCDNDLCDRYVQHNGGPGVMDGSGTVGIGSDGTVVKAAVTGSERDGGPFIEYARCTRDGCEQAWIPVRASAREPFGRPELAVASAPDGAVWFALAMPSPDGQAGAPTYRVSLIRCAQTPCTKPQRHQAGTLERTPEDGYPENRRAQLSIDPDGRPIAVFWIGWALQTITCEPVTCVGPRKSETSGGTPDARRAAPSRLGDEPVSFVPGQLRVGDQLVPLKSTNAAPESGALAVAGSRIYATAATSTTRPTGFHISYGTSEEHWQQTLWICERTRCRSHPLDVFQDASAPEMMAVGADGRVLIVRNDRITLTTLPDPD